MEPLLNGQMLQNSQQILMNSNSMNINRPILSISDPNVNVPNPFGPINCLANQNMNNMMNINPHSMVFMNNNQNLMNVQNYNMNNNMNNMMNLDNTMMNLNNNMNMNMGLNNNNNNINMNLNNNMNMGLSNNNMNINLNNNNMNMNINLNNNNNMNMINIPSMNNSLQNMNLNQNINNINNNVNNVPIQNMNMMTNQVNNPNFNIINNNNLLNFTESLYNPPKGYQVSDSTRLILNNYKIERSKLISNNGIIITPAMQCGLCFDLVMTPVECKNCTKLFCKECIDNCLKAKNECPFKHKFKKQENIDEWAQKVFAKLYLKCPYKGCVNDYAYKHWMNHVKNCPMKNNGIKDLNNNGEEVKDVFQWHNIQFFVKPLQGATLLFNLPLSTTVKELKEKLEEKTPIKASEQRLELNGKTMEDSKMLYYYNLQPNNTVHQIARLKGGL